MTRAGRKSVAWLCLSVLLFMQLAVAAYAGTTVTAGNPTVVASVDGPEKMPCGGMDQRLPNLCEQHCLQASQSVDTQPHSGVTAPTLPLLAVIVQTDRYVPTKHDVGSVALVHPLDPPPLIRFGVLRI
jgi:hypothetical protein